MEDRDKRKRADAISPPSDSNATSLVDEKGLKTDAGDEVFVIEGSPSPGTTREIKKRKEKGPSSFHAVLEDLTTKSGITDMSTGLRQLMEKMERLSGDLSYETKKQVNTKVEIKKMARELDTMSQSLSRKLNKFCTAVSRKLRKSSDRDDTPTGTKRGSTQDAASQTDPLPRKQKGEEMQRVTSAVTDEEIVDAASKKWSEGWFTATTTQTGNPWISSGEVDYAILLADSEEAMDSGIARLLRDRYPEVGDIKGTGSLKVTSTVQVGTAVGKVRKLAELVFRHRNTKREAGKKARRDKNTEALLIKQEGKTYGEMVRGLRALVGVSNDALKQVRKAQDGRLLLTFKKGEPEVEGLKSLIQKSWEGAEVSGGGNGGTRKDVFHLRHMDVAVDDREAYSYRT